MYHKTQPSESDYSLHILVILQKTLARLITLRESLCLSLCRDPHVLLDADAELDLNLVVVVDLDTFHQPGNDHAAVGTLHPGTATFTLSHFHRLLSVCDGNMY